MDRKFMIFNVSELNLVNFSEVVEDSANTVRKSRNGTKTFVKWDGIDTPSCLSNLTTTEGPYTYNEMISILSTTEWLPEIIPL